MAEAVQLPPADVKTTASHPLDPLTPEEVERAAALVKPRLGDQAAFCSVALVEPPKDALKAYAPGDPLPRRLRFMGFDYPEGEPDGGFDAIVDLSAGTADVSRIAKGQAPIGFADVVRAVRITKEDPGWQAAMRERGVTDFEHVQIDPWPAGGYQHPSIPAGHRAHRAISFVRENKTDNGYARPVQGLIAHVDLTAGRVAHLEDHGTIPLPPEHGRYDAASQPKLRSPLKPLEISQPDGPGFTVEGGSITWGQLAVPRHHAPHQRPRAAPVGSAGMAPGKGDDAPWRSVLHRAALSDMVVPYGDPDPMHGWKHVLDAGEASIGNCANSLMLGCDCLGEIHYLDHVAVKPDGSARLIERAICIHEEDYGILWKHHDGHGQTTEVRRSRRLVVSAFHTVGNYEYGFYWYLYLDGTIQMEAKLTGIVGVSAVNEGEERPEYAPLIAPNLVIAHPPAPVLLPPRLRSRRRHRQCVRSGRGTRLEGADQPRRHELPRHRPPACNRRRGPPQHRRRALPHVEGGRHRHHQPPRQARRLPPEIQAPPQHCWQTPTPRSLPVPDSPNTTSG